jgi:hypothetical protein
MQQRIDKQLECNANLEMRCTSPSMVRIVAASYQLRNGRNDG